MGNVFFVTEHPTIGAVVDFGNQMVAFNKSKGKVALNTSHYIHELPDAIFRCSDNPTLKEAATAFVEKRRPRWAEKGLYK